MSIYDIPTVWLFFIFTFIIVLISVLGLFLLKKVNTKSVKCEDHNTIIAILIGVMSVFLGVMVSFLILTSWGIYSKASLDVQKEAQSIGILFEVISTLPNTEKTQALIIAYLNYIINVEFPAIKEGQLPPEGEAFTEEIQRLLYDYIPEGAQETVLYQRSIQLIDVIIDLRINRISIATSGLNQLIWWVSIIDSVLIIVMSYFLNCNRLFHYLVIIVIAIYVAVGLFTTLVLSNPFRGSNGISSQAYQNTLNYILPINTEIIGE